MKQGLLTLAGVSLAMAVAVPAHALDTDSIPAFTRATYNLAQAYPCTVGTFPASLGVSDLRVWAGSCGDSTNISLTPADVAAGQALGGATPGVLCLARNGLALDVNCFAVATAADGQYPPCFVQAYRLIKQVPGSFKCPDVYGMPHFVKDSNGNLVLAPYQYFQFGTGVRTWWSLNFSQPGTKFILEVVSVCRSSQAGGGVLGSANVHKDRWIWRVVTSPETVLNLINVMHGSAVSTLEVPCIIGEDMYDALIKAQSRLAGAVSGGSGTDIGNAVFDMEALIISNCLFTDVLTPLLAFPGAQQTFPDLLDANGNPIPVAGIQPPGNLAQPVLTQIAGIIDTTENPCCCKLLVDLEWISIKNGLIGQTPTLPTF